MDVKRLVTTRTAEADNRSCTETCSKDHGLS